MGVVGLPSRESIRFLRCFCLSQARSIGNDPLLAHDTAIIELVANKTTTATHVVNGFQKVIDIHVAVEFLPH